MNAAAQVSTTDSAFIHDSRPIIPFVVGKKDIEQQDRKWITNYLIPKLKALGDSGIIIGRASASPEGSLQINTQLANARKASMNALLSSYGINTNLIRYDVAPMDFPLMRALMKLRKDDYLPVVDSLMTDGLYGVHGSGMISVINRVTISVDDDSEEISAGIAAALREKGFSDGRMFLIQQE